MRENNIKVYLCMHANCMVEKQAVSRHRNNFAQATDHYMGFDLMESIFPGQEFDPDTPPGE